MRTTSAYPRHLQQLHRYGVLLAIRHDPVQVGSESNHHKIGQSSGLQKFLYLLEHWLEYWPEYWLEYWLVAAGIDLVPRLLSTYTKINTLRGRYPSRYPSLFAGPFASKFTSKFAYSYASRYQLIYSSQFATHMPAITSQYASQCTDQYSS